MGVLAGGTLGGGTFVNSLVCFRLPDDVREEWARHGVLGHRRARVRRGAGRRLAAPRRQYRGHRAQRQQPAHGRGAGEHGAHAGGFSPGTRRRTIRDSAATAMAAASRARSSRHCDVPPGRGGRRGSLHGRVPRGADPRRGGRAVGVEAVWTGRTAIARDVTVRAPTVVVAGGGIESPALLLRSGIGGPAVGEQPEAPSCVVRRRGARRSRRCVDGQIQSVTSLDFRVLPHGGGFLPECVILNLAFWTSAMPWVDGVAHKRRVLELSRTPRGTPSRVIVASGRVVLAPDGGPVVQWELHDPRDLETARIANVELARLHEAAGARSIFTFDPPGLRWVRGEEPFESFLDRLRNVDWRRGDRLLGAPDVQRTHGHATRRRPSPTVEGRLHDVAGRVGRRRVGATGCARASTR